MSSLQVHVTTPHLLFLYMGSEDRSQIAILTRQALYQPSSLPVLTHSLAFSRLLWDPASLSEGESSPLRQPETNPSQGFLSYGPDTSRSPPPTLLSAHDRRKTGGREAGDRREMRRMRLCGIPLWPSPPLRSRSGILPRQSPPLVPVPCISPSGPSVSYCGPAQRPVPLVSTSPLHLPQSSF